MKAQVFINRHIVARNKKLTKETGRLVDEPAISVNTYKGAKYVKKLKLAEGVHLIQDAASPRCSGATIWIEVDNVDMIQEVI